MKTRAPRQLSIFTKRAYAKPLTGKAALLARYRQFSEELQQIEVEIESTEMSVLCDEDGWEALVEEQERLVRRVTNCERELAPLVKGWWLT